MDAPVVTTVPNPAEVTAYVDTFNRLAGNIERVLMGKPDVVRLALAVLFAEGHLLVEDVPGTGKTTLARAVAASVDGGWRRIQFTPDLLPTDITGVSIFHQETRQFEFHPGPVFAHIVIADEINRASPKTQSALLEVMDEGFVTVDGVRRPVPRPFLVVATQNPVEMDGTYRLPEAQLDRFMAKLSVGYPGHAAEVDVLRAGVARRSPDQLAAVTDTAAVAAFSWLVSRVHVHDLVHRYVARLARATREHPRVRVGLSPRGGIALLRAAQAHALADGRTYVLPEDVQALAAAVVAHRLLPHPGTGSAAWSTMDIVAEVMAATPSPQPPVTVDAATGVPVATAVAG
jgi:MoxR-like ATPase